MTAMKTRFVRSMFAPALLLAALSGCEGLLNEGNDAQRDQFTAANNRWDAANISSYSYVVEIACDCGTSTQLRPVVVTVQNGATVSRVYQNTNPAEAAPEAIFGAYDTVEELFVAVENGIGRDADVLNVIYHPTYGVPVLLQWDPDNLDPDDHLAFQVSGFTPAAAP